LAHFQCPANKWSKKAGAEVYRRLRVEFPWYKDVSGRVTKNAIDDLDAAYQHFFRRVKLGQKPGYPRFKKKGISDSFSIREVKKFRVEGRWLRIEKLGTRIKMSQLIRWEGEHRQVTIRRSPDGRYWASVLVRVTNYDVRGGEGSVGVDLGVSKLATLSDGTEIPSNQPLKRGLKKLRKWQRKLSRKVKGSNRRARAKLKVARIHQRISNQRKATIHELTDRLTRGYGRVVIEDLNVKGMVQNRSLARSISDAGFGMFRSTLEYKARLRGVEVVVVDRWYPSSKTCSSCGAVKEDLSLSDRVFRCGCGLVMDRDHNAAVNILRNGEDALRPTEKRAEERCETSACRSSRDDAANETCL
jgi:putative transposase